MSTDDPLDAVSGSISDGDPVDWDLTESAQLDADERESVQALREVERVVEYHRALQRSPSPGGIQVLAGSAAGASHSNRTGQVWGGLTLLELARAGVSGEVWRAWDAWLHRDVALKFLQTLTGPGEGVRSSALLEEARALARVRHPGVVAVHGIAEHEGRVGMWMEFLEGTTLAAVIERRGALPPREVAHIGLELARALEAVESAGVVHRDIKPANIVLETTGRVVLTDFGLGRRWEIADPRWRASGTPIFMSPGVLSGQPATPRSDIYSLGVTLRWALTGHPPFEARTLEELRVEAKTGPSKSLADERPDAPAALIAAIDRAMAPDPEARFAGAAQMAAALKAVLAKMDTRSPWHRARLGIIVAGAGVVAIGLAAFLPRFLERRVSPSIASFSVQAPPDNVIVSEPAHTAISPDGTLLAFVAVDSNHTRRIWLRPLNSLSARALEGSEGADELFWSPDSRNLGFFAEGKLKRVSVAGGSPEVVCAAMDHRGASWGSRGVIVFAPVAAGPLCRVSAEGGPVTELLKPDSTRGETALRWPEFLPDGKHFFFVSLPPRDGSFDVDVSSIDSRERQRVLRSDSAPVCAGKDQLLLTRGGHLMAQRFDFKRLRPLGEPVSLGPATAADVSVGERLSSASMNGVLVHPTATLANTQLIWRDREGRRQGTLAAPEGRYEKLVFSPDGRRVLVVRRGSASTVDLWMIDLATGLATRLTAGSQTRIGGWPAWSPDGSRVAFSSNRNGVTNIYQKVVDHGGVEELLYESSGQFKEVDSWSPDGRYLLFEQADPVSGWDLWLLPMQGERKPIPYLRTTFHETGGQVSPDGRWTSYQSDESGHLQVNVQPFPKPGEKFLVTPKVGGHAHWARNGRELFYIDQEGTIWSVPVTSTPSFRVGTARPLFKMRSDALWVAATPDLQRFLESVPSEAVPTTISVQLNWPATFEKK